MFYAYSKVFRLKRWLEVKLEHLAKMNSTVNLIFHSGKYQYLNSLIALMEFNKVFVQLLRTFDLSITNAEKPAQITNVVVAYAKNSIASTHSL